MLTNKRKINLKNHFHNFMKQFWNELWDDKQNFCPKCGSQNIVHLIEEKAVYNIHWERIGQKDWGCEWSGELCYNCEWNNF